VKLTDKQRDGMTPFEWDVLRLLNGEDVPSVVAGAALWSACEVLVERGLAEGHYRITDLGRQALNTNSGGERE